MLSQPPGLPVQNQPLQRDPVWVIFEILQIQYRVSGKLGLDKHPSFSNSVASPIVKAPGSNGQQSFPGAGDREPKSRSSPGDSEAVNSLSYMHSFSISFTPLPPSCLEGPACCILLLPSPACPDSSRGCWESSGLSSTEQLE